MSSDSIPGVARVPRFMAFAWGQTVSQFGDKLDQMALVAILGTAASSAKAAWSLAQLAVVVALPVLFFAPVAGVLVDRWDRRTTLVAGDVVRALLVASIPAAYSGLGSLWPIYLIVFLVFLVTMVSNAAKMAVVPDLVDRRQLLAANALMTSMGRVATVAGIVLGGFVIDWRGWVSLGISGYQAAFYIDGVSFAISALMLAVALPKRPPLAGAAPGPPPGEIAPAATGAVRRFASDFGDAVRLVRSNRDLAFVFSTIALVAAAVGAGYVLVVVLVQTILEYGSSGLGILGGIGAGGMVIGSVVAGTAVRRWPKRSIITAGSLALGLLVAVIPGVSSFAGLAAVSFAIGACLAPVAIAQDTWLQDALQERARGRGFAIRELLNNACGAGASVAAAIAVVLIAAVGFAEPYQVSLVALGVLLLVAMLALALFTERAERRAGDDAPIEEAAPGASSRFAGAMRANGPGGPVARR